MEQININYYNVIIYFAIVQVEPSTSMTKPFKHVYEDFKYSYADHNVLKWSLWQVVAISGYIQVLCDIIYKYIIRTLLSYAMRFTVLHKHKGDLAKYRNLNS